jgi:hypothetical protein
VKKAIELLERVKADLRGDYHDRDGGVTLFMGEDIIEILDEAIAELKNRPRWETPEQYERRTGEPWPDTAAVYTRSSKKIEPWDTILWGMHKKAVAFVERFGYSAHDPYVVCATEAGPPPDGREPEA